MMTGEEIEIIQHQDKKPRTEDSTKSESDGLVSTEVDSTPQKPKAGVLNRLDKIEKLVAKLRKAYEKYASEYEEQLIEQIAETLDDNLTEYFDDDGNRLK